MWSSTGCCSTSSMDFALASRFFLCAGPSLINTSVTWAIFHFVIMFSNTSDAPSKCKCRHNYIIISFHRGNSRDKNSFPTYTKSEAETSEKRNENSIILIKVKTLWRRVKLLIMSNFSLCHNVFNSRLQKRHPKASLCRGRVNCVKDNA